MNKITAYFTEAFAELQKVSWPTRKQTINYSIVVIVISLAVAIFFGLLDFAFTWLLGIII